jgi:hypothetical protein
VIIIQDNGIVKTISINKKLGVKTKRPQVLVCYDLMEGLTNKDEDIIFEIEPKLFSIGTITISYETISLLNVRVIEIIINGKFKPKQRISYQGVAKVVVSTTKTTKFNVILETSLEDKVYLETYYHHN